MTEVNKIENLGEKIKAKRIAERLSAKDLAIKLNLKAENIYKWEKGSTPSDAQEFLIITGWLNNLEYVPNKLDLPQMQLNDHRVDDSKSLPLGDLHVTLKDYVDLLKDKAQKAEEREREYLEIIKLKLISIDANSKEMAEDIEALTTEVQAEHRAMMDTMDVAAKQPIGTTRAAAGTVEIASEQEYLNKGKKTGIDKNAATGKKR